MGRVAGRLLLGRIPETAKQGSLQEEKPAEDSSADESAPTEMSIETETKEPAKFIDAVNEEDQSLLEGEIFDQVFANGNKAPADEDSTAEREWKVGEPEKQKELSTV